jgi:pilus assembly protein Flp/PilA
MMPRAISSFLIFLADRRGATSIEYGLLLALLALAIITGITALGNATGAALENTASMFPD